MLAISPQFSAFHEWFMEDPIIHEHSENLYYLSGEKTQTPDSTDHLHSPNSSRSQATNGESTSFKGVTKNIVKKLNHNASERDRRKKINTLYSTLRSLLPPEDQAKKLSIPSTVSRVLKYIPELQKEVEGLIRKKERVVSKVSSQKESSSSLSNIQKQRSMKSNQSCSLSATQISDGEVAIQGSVAKVEKSSITEAVMRLEEEGLIVMNASCFESSDGRVFYNFHLQALGSQVVHAEVLKEKFLFSHENCLEQITQIN